VRDRRPGRISHDQRHLITDVTLHHLSEHPEAWIGGPILTVITPGDNWPGPAPDGGHDDRPIDPGVPGQAHEVGKPTGRAPDVRTSAAPSTGVLRTP
jgi:hypothetical protein